MRPWGVIDVVARAAPVAARSKSLPATQPRARPGPGLVPGAKAWMAWLYSSMAPPEPPMKGIVGMCRATFSRPWTLRASGFHVTLEDAYWGRKFCRAQD